MDSKLLYSNLDNIFFLLDYSPSHSQLVIRSKKVQNREYNVDILFKGVSNIFIKTNVNGIKISKLLKIDNFDFPITQGKEVYILETSENEKFYINALCCGIFHTKLEILETVIGRYDLGQYSEECIFWFD